MNVRRLTVSAAVAGLTILAAPAALAAAPTGSSGTGSSAIDTGSAATGSAGVSQTGSAGGAFANCDDARAAGRAPIFRGEPGFGPHLDPDGDGFACPTV
ncbi:MULTISPECIES: excalibur calcium-binding domain-containing protein [Nocardia]|uniref:Excalibur calcium-binding domain-containing protein n=2 Tax=Nocardia TaxID=1817 RepID=A0A285LCF7_9NOCA|nr:MULTISPECIES: excalibur calcium-binding domain-containing protein [Nocardia]MCP2280477.1 Excalibur calcium-binding domain-containing protein [Nocardia amikacinitolerans]MCP2292032.1 Excalibur calcium-binding domain-containing protein [Nocardia amikacinitolerans]MCP2297565.1 Excalibur calcium-binding domain-containing protein [Nocardia amikacinitolerans]MCP2320048.1 Excalibur calcium-binding domain-containing protein [Nocardia amikacinitolerans]TQM25474.1 excalibur calcium-binding domain-con